jgi:hypothetical protein
MRILAKILLGLIPLAGIAGASSAVAAEPTRETRALSQPFTAIRLEGSLDLSISQADVPALIIEARPDQMARIRSEVRDGVLILSYDSPLEIHFGTHNSHSPRALLSAKSLKRISVKGSGDVSIGTWTTTEDMEFALSGSGDASIEALTARNLKLSIAGSDDARIAGSVDGLEVSIAGSGDFEGGNLKSAAAKVSVAGSGDVVVWATKALSVNVAGSGDVSYYGHPSVTHDVAGSGGLRSLGDK